LRKASRVSGSAVNTEFENRLHTRIRWLNTAGGFENTIKYSTVIQAAQGFDETDVMQVLRRLEQTRDRVDDPTRWVCVALQRAYQPKQGPGGKKTLTYQERKKSDKTEEAQSEMDPNHENNDSSNMTDPLEGVGSQPSTVGEGQTSAVHENDQTSPTQDAEVVSNEIGLKVADMQ